MEKLKSIVQDKQRQKDPYWSSIYNTDMRNLFPKYEIAKIDKAKAKFDKFRLMMENIEDFLFIEIHRKESKRIVEQVDNIKQQIAQLRKQEEHYHYQIDLINQRQQAQIICQQLTKYGNQCQNNISHKNFRLDNIVKQNEKWEQYFSQKCKKPDTAKNEKLLIEKVELAKTIKIPNQCEALNQSTSSQILLNRYKKELINKKLLQTWISSGDEGINLDKQVLPEWRNTIKNIDFKEYV